MEQRNLLDAQVLARRTYNLLTETMDLSRQLAEAMDRNDQVSMQMLIAMREEPVAGLRQADQSLRQLVADLPDPQDQQRMYLLLQGEKAENEAETPLAEQVAANRRLLSQVLELDRSLSLKLAGDQSIYQE